MTNKNLSSRERGLFISVAMILLFLSIVYGSYLGLKQKKQAELKDNQWTDSGIPFYPPPASSLAVKVEYFTRSNDGTEGVTIYDPSRKEAHTYMDEKSFAWTGRNADHPRTTFQYFYDSRANISVKIHDYDNGTEAVYFLLPDFSENGQVPMPALDYVGELPGRGRK